MGLDQPWDPSNTVSHREANAALYARLRDRDTARDAARAENRIRRAIWIAIVLAATNLEALLLIVADVLPSF